MPVDPTALGLSRSIAEARAQLEASSHRLSLELQLHNVVKTEFHRLTNGLHLRDAPKDEAGTSDLSKEPTVAVSASSSAETAKTSTPKAVATSAESPEPVADDPDVEIIDA